MKRLRRRLLSVKSVSKKQKRKMRESTNIFPQQFKKIGKNM